MASIDVTERRTFSSSGFVLAMLVVIAVFGACAWFFWPSGTRPSFGDVFSAVNALVSGLAFMALFFTMLMQRDELELQRQELRDTREELKRSATAQEQSEEALRLQADSMALTAKLNAIDSLLRYYQAQRQSLLSFGNSGTSPIDSAQQMEVVTARIAELSRTLNALYPEVTAVGTRSENGPA